MTSSPPLQAFAPGSSGLRGRALAQAFFQRGDRVVPHRNLQGTCRVPQASITLNLSEGA